MLLLLVCSRSATCSCVNPACCRIATSFFRSAYAGASSSQTSATPGTRSAFDLKDLSVGLDIISSLFVAFWRDSGPAWAFSGFSLRTNEVSRSPAPSSCRKATDRFLPYHVPESRTARGPLAPYMAFRDLDPFLRSFQGHEADPRESPEETQEPR